MHRLPSWHGHGRRASQHYRRRLPPYAFSVRRRPYWAPLMYPAVLAVVACSV